MSHEKKKSHDLSKSATRIPIDELFENLGIQPILSDEDTVEKLDNDEKPNTKTHSDFSNERYSAFKLFKMDIDNIPSLIEPILPKQALVSLVGSSDTGKSTILRQLALSIALGLDSFIGYKLNPDTKNVIYISTEDDPSSVSFSIKKSLKKLFNKNEIDESTLNHIKFIFDVDLDEKSKTNIFKLLDNDLSQSGADLIIVDAFTDLFSGDINSSTKVREFLNKFNALTRKHKCLILFLHHTGKHTDRHIASKNNALGSQAFEAKMRVLLELNQHPHNEMQRTLTINKGNYISTQIKKYSKVLDFDEEHLLFSDTGKRLTIEQLASMSKSNPKKNEMLPIIKKLHGEGLSIRKITAELTNMGHKVGKSTVDNYIKEIKANPPSNIQK